MDRMENPTKGEGHEVPWVLWRPLREGGEERETGLLPDRLDTRNGPFAQPRNLLPRTEKLALLIGTAICGKPYVRWRERAGEIKPSPLYSIRLPSGFHPIARPNIATKEATVHEVVINENGFMGGLHFRPPAVVAAIAFDELPAFMFSSAMFDHRDQIVSALAANQHGVITISAVNGFQLFIGEFNVFLFGELQNFFLVLARLDLGDLLFG